MQCFEDASFLLLTKKEILILYLENSDIQKHNENVIRVRKKLHPENTIFIHTLDLLCLMFLC